MNDLERMARALAAKGDVCYERSPKWFDGQARAVLEAFMEPNKAAWEGWRSVNCKYGTHGMEEFTYFEGDYGNWLARLQAMLQHILEEGE